MRTLEEMVAVGKAKLTDKEAAMKASWEAARARMKVGYGKTPFGPTRKSNYNLRIDKAVFRLDTEKWATNWAAKMKE